MKQENNFKNISWQINEGDKWILYGLNGDCDNTSKYFKMRMSLRQPDMLIYLVKCPAR